MCDEVAGYSGETIELLGGRFRYWFYSDVKTGAPPRYPLTGTYQHTGSEVVLSNAAIHRNRRTFATVNGVHVLWRDDGLRLWKSEKRVHPYAVLIRVGNAAVGDEMPERPTIKLLYSQDMLDREEREYRERDNDQPREARVLLRAESIRGDPDVRIYVGKIRQARANLSPQLVGQLVGIMGYRDDDLSVRAESVLEALYLRTFLLREDPPFRHDEKEPLRALNILVDAVSEARDRRALEKALLVLLRASGLKRISLRIPEAGVIVELERIGKDGARMTGGHLAGNPNVPRTYRWTDKIRTVSRACQEWCRTQLKTSFVFTPPSPVEEEETTSEVFTGADVSRLIEDLSTDKEWGTRLAAAHGLASLREKAIPALVQTMGADSTRISMAAYALGKMREPASIAVPALVKALGSKDADTRNHAAWALGRIGPAAKAAVPLLKALLEDAEKSVRYNASFALDCIQLVDDTE